MEAINATEGSILVQAGPGTGKTSVLVNRFVHLVNDRGISSNNILCVTFSNKAAIEIRERIIKEIPYNSHSKFIKTFHGLCVTILREHIGYINLDKNFQIIDSKDQKRLFEIIKKELSLDKLSINDKEIIKALNEVKKDISYVQLLSGASELSVNCKTPELSLMVNQYLKKQKQRSYLDFDDLINCALFLLQKNPNILSYWQGIFRFIQVDEFQDCNSQQFELIKLLSAKYQNVFVVGDPNQAIYSWRGSNPVIFEEYISHFKPHKVIHLKLNYRCTPQVMNFANDLINHNKQQMPSRVYTNNPNGNLVAYYHLDSDKIEAQYIINHIHNLSNVQLVPLKDIAILCRTKTSLKNIEKSLLTYRIPYENYSAENLLQNAEVRMCLCYLKMVAFRDDLSFEETIRKPSRNIGKKKIEFIISYAENNDLSYYVSLITHQNTSILRNSDINGYINIIEKYTHLIEELSISELLKGILEDTNLFNYNDLTDNKVINTFLDYVEYMQSINPELKDLSNFLQHISLFSQEQIENNDCIKLMTVHASKGLEFPYVIIPDFVDGIYPSFKATSKFLLEEERRIIYVAITRAKKDVIITSSKNKKGSSYRNNPSKFIYEINSNYFLSYGLFNSDKENTPKQHTLNTHHFSIYNASDKITHAIYGDGIIAKVNNNEMNYYIEFFGEKSTVFESIKFTDKELKKY